MRVENLVPAGVGVEEAPPNIIVADVLHATAAVEESGQHALTQLDYAHILFCLGWLRSVVGDGVFLGNWRDDQGWVQCDQSCSQRSELAITSSYFDVLPGSVSGHGVQSCHVLRQCE